MATVTKKQLDDLIKRIEHAGWEIKDQGMRWRVTNPEGGGPVFIPKTPPRNNTLKKISDELIARGWNEHANAEANVLDRKQRLAAAQAANNQRILEVEELLRAEREEQAITATDKAERYRRMKAQSRVTPGGVRKDAIEINAALAREILQHNNAFHDRDPESGKWYQRPVDHRLVEKFAKQMLAGKWRYPHHQGMAMDVNGDFFDGQHRLLALIEADKEQPGITITTEITYDLPPENAVVTDAGKARTTADVLALHALPNRNHLNAALRLIYAYDSGEIMAFNQVRLLPDQVLELADEHPAIHETIRRAMTYRRTGIPMSPLAAGVYLAERAYHKAPMDEFLHGLNTGYDLSEGDPRAAMRRFADNARRRKHVSVRNHIWLALFIKTWNKWITGETAKDMAWRNKEQFPNPVEHHAPAAG